MIQIIEKEPYYDDSPFTGKCWRHPTYMAKDGKEHFMFNRTEPQPPYKAAEDEARKNFLISTNGRYMKFNGYKDDPLEMLKIAAERKHHFTDPENIWWCDFEERGYTDFHGNFREVSAAFHYRIYDAELISAIKEAAENLKAERWEAVKGATT